MTISVTDQVSDSGELAAAAYVWGVPHPTGYPLYMLLGGVISHLPLGEPAYDLNLFSALCGALAVGLIALLAAGRLARHGILGAAWSEAGAAPRNLPAACGGLAGGLVFGADPAFWLQATNTETRTLAAVFVAAVLLLLCQLWGEGYGRTLLAAWGVEGLALADHLLCLALLPALLLATATCPLPMGRRMMARARLALWCLLALLPGLALYAYLPLRAATSPALDWGDPRTPARFMWMVTGAQYRPLMGLTPAQIPAALADRVSVVLADMGPLLLVAALVGYGLLVWRQRRVALLVGVTALAGLLQSALYGADAAPDYLIPALVALAVAAGFLCGRLLAICVRRSRLAGRPAGATMAWRVAMLAVAAVAVLGLAGEASRQNATDAQAESGDTRLAAVLDLQGAPRHTLVLASADFDTFPLWYAQFALGVRPDVAVVNTGLLAWQWYADTVRRHYPWLRWGNAPWPDADGDLAVTGADEQAATRERDLVLANLRRVTIYWTQPDDVLTAGGLCGVAMQGDLMRCVPLRRR